MLTLPKIVERQAQTYVAISEDVTIPFGPVIERTMPEVANWLAGRGVSGFGPAIFKYNLVAMPRLGMEFGFITDTPPAGDGRVRGAVLPAGRYVTVTYFGPYDDLESVTAVVIGWAKQRGIAWDSTMGPDGEVFAARFELYLNGPMDEPDPQKWETQIFVKIRE